MSMNVQVLHQTSVIPTLCVPILKDHTYVAVVGVTKEMVEIAQVSKLLGIEIVSLLVADRGTLFAFHQTFTKFLLSVRKLSSKPPSKINVGKNKSMRGYVDRFDLSSLGRGNKLENIFVIPR